MLLFLKEMSFSKCGLGYIFSNNIVLTALLQIKNAAKTQNNGEKAYIIPQRFKKKSVKILKTKFLLIIHFCTITQMTGNSF